MKRYRSVFVAVAALLGFIFFYPHLLPVIKKNLVNQVSTMLLFIPPVFLLLGLLDVWVPREKMVQFMGPEAGFKGPVLAFLIGSAAAGPLYGAFPVAAVLMKKGASFTNILILVGAWSTTKIPMLIFEMKALGLRFALARLCIDIPGIIIIAAAIKACMSKTEIDQLYAAAAETSPEANK